jgi:serine/threonine protein kinase/WD40 repeat protein
MSHQDAPNSADDRVGLVVEAFLTRFRKGERPSLAELVTLHPELAEELQAIIPALVELEQIGGSTGSMAADRPEGPNAAAGNHPDSLGDYKIIRRIGGGGMGEVYEAEHQSLKSRVALKVMHPRFRSDEKYLRRFNIEARSAAGLHHTNIVTVFDYGEQGGVCYYAMQYIDGQPLDCVLNDLRRLKANGSEPIGGARRVTRPATALVTGDGTHSVALRLLTGGIVPGDPGEVLSDETEQLPSSPGNSSRTTIGKSESAPGQPNELPSFNVSSIGGPIEGRYYREIARACAKVADALEYAHRAGVLHRDIKPSNLLLDPLGNVWVTDFGLAKLEGGEEVSKSQDLVGTLRYMAPERFRGISSRAGDIYALGATLYELVTLRPAFNGSDQLRLIDQIVHEPPERPRLIDRHVPRDLETIVMRALANEPGDRFRTAHEMAEELRRFVEGLPIRSRDILFTERFWRWCKREPWLAGANVAAATTTIALAIGSTIAAKFYYDRQEDAAAYAKQLENSETKGRKELFEARVAQTRASRFSHQVGLRFDGLRALSDAVRIGRDLRLGADRFEELRDQAIATMMLPDLEPSGRSIQLPETTLAYAVDENMTRYALRLRDRIVVVRRFDDDQEIARFTAKDDAEIGALRFSPDARYLASLEDGVILVWDVDRKQLVWTSPDDCEPWAAAFSPDSRRIATVKYNILLLHDLTTRRALSWTGPTGLSAFVYRPDGKEIAVDYHGNPGTCQILDAESLQPVRSFPVSSGGPLAWSPDGSTLALSATLQDITFFNASRGERGATHALPISARGGVAFGFHPAGRLLSMNSGWEGRLRLWDPATARQLLSFRCGGGEAFTKDGRLLIRQGNTISPWQVDPGDEYTTLAYASNTPHNHVRVSIHKDGRIIAVGTDRGVILWDLARKSELGFLRIGNSPCSVFEPTGDLITNGVSGCLRWPIKQDATSGELSIGPPRILIQAGSICMNSSDRTGQTVAVAALDEARVALGERTITIGPLADCRRVSVSPDGKWLATGYHNVTGVTIWSLPDGDPVAKLPVNVSAFDGPQFSPDGKWLVAESRTIKFLEVGTWREVREIEGSFANFSPDGRYGAVWDQNDTLCLVEIATGRILARLERPDQQRRGWVAFSPDSSRIVMTSNDPPSTQVIDLRAIRRRLADMRLDWEAPAFPDVDTARPDLPPLAPLKIEYGHLDSQSENLSENLEVLQERYTERIKKNPGDADAYYSRAKVLALFNPVEAIQDLTQALVLRPNTVDFLLLRARINDRAFGRWEPAIADLETVLRLDPKQKRAPGLLASSCSKRAGELAASSRSEADLQRAIKLSDRALQLAPKQPLTLKARGLVLYRAGKYAEAVKNLEEGLEAANGQRDVSDFLVLAMAHHRLGHREEARRSFEKATHWLSCVPEIKTGDLAKLRSEAESNLTGEQAKQNENGGDEGGSSPRSSINR